MSNPPDDDPDSPSQPRFGALRTGLLIAGSALLGGLAVVLWNRKTLAGLRQPPDPPNKATVQEDEDRE